MQEFSGIKINGGSMNHRQIEYSFAILLATTLKQFKELTTFGKISYHLDEEVDDKFFRIGYLQYLIDEKNLLKQLLEKQLQI